MDIWIVSVILIVTLYLLISEKLRMDITAIGVIAVLMVSGVLLPTEAVAGFSSPAVITVGCMFLISRALIRTGAVGFIEHHVNHLSGGRPTLAVLVILAMVALASAFINNTPVVVLFIPVVLRMSCQFNISPSKLLIPVSYASILAGTCTLIGTSTNIIVSDLSMASGYGALSMFELAPAGVPMAVLGIIILLLAAPKLMPALVNPTCEVENRRRYLAEIRIPRGSRWIDRAPVEAFAGDFPNLEIIELIRYSHIFYPDRDEVQIAADDLLLVKGSANELVQLIQTGGVELPRAESGLEFGSRELETVVVELIIAPQSSLLRKRLVETELEKDPDLHIIAIQRSGLHYTEKEIYDVELRMGDILLLWCPSDKLDNLRTSVDFILVDDVHHEIIHKKKAKMAGLIFFTLVSVAALGLADIMTSAIVAVFLMIVTGCIQPRDAYRALQSDVLLLVVGMIALGAAMDQTGASQFYADAFLRMFHGTDPRLVLGAVILLTSLVTHVLSNNAAAVLVYPVAVSTALSLGVAPKPFIVAVCFGASACFATPIGYQTNLLVYGPGGYRFSDYMKLGLVLNTMVIVGGAFLIPHFWPL